MERMGRRVHRLAAVAAAAASISVSSIASAQTSVLASPPDASELRDVRVAVSSGPSRSTLWFAGTVYGAADAVFVVVPAAPGAAVDLATDGWFEALHEATDTHIVPPIDVPSVTCAAATLPNAGDVHVVGDAAHVAGVVPSTSAQIMGFTELVVWTQSEGLALSTDEISALADLELEGFRFVALRFEAPPGEAALRTVRVAAPTATLRVPLLLTASGSASVRMNVWVFAEARATPQTLPALSVAPSELLWSLGGTASPTNYEELWNAKLASVNNAGWIVDAAAHGLVFRTTPLPGGAGGVSSVVESYLERAAIYGDANPEVAACVTKVASLEASKSRVAEACAAGNIALIPGGPACVETPVTGELDPADLRCGGIANDLALSFSGLVPERIWLSRWTGRVSAWSSRPEETFLIADGAPLSPVVVSTGYDSTICESDGGTSGSGGAGGSGGGSPNTGGASVPPGQSPYDPPPDYGEDDYDDSSGGTDVYVEGSCWGDSSSSSSSDGSSDSCSGDSSSTSSEGDSCSGDSSSTSSESDSCSGDSSNSSSDSCSGDSSGSSSGDSCSGDSSGSSGGESCDSGGSSSGGESCSGGSSSGSSDCAVSAGASGRRRGRLPTSAFALLLVASGLAARRKGKVRESRPLFR